MFAVGMLRHVFYWDVHTLRCSLQGLQEWWQCECQQSRSEIKNKEKNGLLGRCIQCLPVGCTHAYIEVCSVGFFRSGCRMSAGEIADQKQRKGHEDPALKVGLRPRFVAFFFPRLLRGGWCVRGRVGRGAKAKENGLQDLCVCGWDFVLIRFFMFKCYYMHS